jgi:hypothetical protein
MSHRKKCGRLSVGALHIEAPAYEVIVDPGVRRELGTTQACVQNTSACLAITRSADALRSSVVVQVIRDGTEEPGVSKLIGSNEPISHLTVEALFGEPASSTGSRCRIRVAVGKRLRRPRRLPARIRPLPVDASFDPYQLGVSSPRASVHKPRGDGP